MKKIFVTFGGPSEGYKKRVKEITIQAKNLNIFDEVIGFNDTYLFQNKEFNDQHYNFLINNWRGFGYWIWKSFIVKKVLSRMNDGDILLYCDAGCELNLNAKNRLYDYINMVKESSSGIFNFHLHYNDDYLEYKYTKNDLFEHLNCDENIKNSNQIIATIFLIKKCKNSINFINEWYNVCCHYNLIDDSPSITPNCSQFCEHRHDQSVLSCLSKKYNGISIPDETYFAPNWEVNGLNYPIWAKRTRK